MKYYNRICFLLVFFTSFVFDLYAQIQPDSINVKNNSCFVVFMNDIPSKEKMSLEKSWITNNFGDYKSVLQYEDEVKKTIVIKGRLQLYRSSLEASTEKLNQYSGKASFGKRYMLFTIEFSNKEDRYRIRISDISIKDNSLIAYGGGSRDNTYEEYTDEGYGKALFKYTTKDIELNKLKAVETKDMKPGELKKHDEDILQCEKELDKLKEKMEKKKAKSDAEKKWLNEYLANIFNSINENMQRQSEDDF